MTASETRKAGRLLLGYFLAFFGAVLAANAVFVYLALRSFSGVETENAYERGLRYNETLRRASKEAALGWILDAALAKAPKGKAAITVQVRDLNGEGVDGLKVTVRFVRPVKAGYDRAVALAPEGGGVYAARVALPFAGQWDARILATGERGETRAVKRFIL
jgi:nitrogen fixation protein FixH